jgi:hypothetical protein
MGAGRRGGMNLPFSTYPMHIGTADNLELGAYNVRSRFKWFFACRTELKLKRVMLSDPLLLCAQHQALVKFAVNYSPHNSLKDFSITFHMSVSSCNSTSDNTPKQKSRQPK